MKATLILCRFITGIALVAVLLLAACLNPELPSDEQSASIKITLPVSGVSRSLHQVSEITGYKIMAYLLESDQKTVVRQEHDEIFYIEQFPVTIDKLSIGYTKFVVEAFDSINNDALNVIALGESIKQLKQGSNTLTINFTWIGNDTPETPIIIDEDESVDYDTSSSIALTLSINDEWNNLYLYRYDYYDPLERAMRVKEFTTLGENFYIGDNASNPIPIQWRWMRSIARGPFQEVANGAGISRNYLETLTINPDETGIHYYYVEFFSDNGIRKQYVNSEIYKVRVMPPPPVYYREPTGIEFTTKNSNLPSDEDAVLASISNETVAVRKNKKAVISFVINYEDSGYIGDPRTAMPTVYSSDNVTIINTEIDDKNVPVYYSCLVEMSQYGGIGWIECAVKDFNLRCNLICAEEIIKDGDWIGAGRLTQFETPEYTVNSSGAYKTKIVYLHGGQSMTNYDWSYIQAFVDDRDEPTDTYWFTVTSSWGGYSLKTPHEFEYVSNYQPTKLRFQGRAGDGTAYIGYVFAYYE
ncbi:hypothetical protein [Treponema sp. R80B11-R83G3]